MRRTEWLRPKQQRLAACLARRLGHKLRVQRLRVGGAGAAGFWEELGVRSPRLRRPRRMGEARLGQRGQIRGDVPALARRSRRGSGASTASASTGSRPTPRSRTSPATCTTFRSSGTRTASPTSPTIASTGICPSAPTRPRSSGKATIPPKSKHITYAELADEVGRFANVLHVARRQEGRPRHHLPADDPRGGLRDARLRAHRRDPFGGVRRLLARRARRPHRRRQVARS